MTMRRIALQASLALDHKRPWKRALHPAAKHHKGELHVGQPLWFWRRGATAAKRPTSAFWHQGVVISNTLATVWVAYRGSVVKCARSQVRPFTEDDEAAHEHIMEHMRDLGERLLRGGDFSYEDVTGHEEPSVDPPTPEENTAKGHQKPDGEGQMDVDPESRRRMRGKTDCPAWNNHQFHLQTQVLTLHSKRLRKIMTTREDALMNLNQQFPQLLRMKF